MSITKEVSQRIAMLRFIMIFGVVILHTPPFVNILTLDVGVFSYTKAFFQSAVFRTSVPVLTFISGYLLFSSDKFVNVMELYKKKFMALMVPFLFFNLTLLVIAYVAQRFAGVSMSADLVNGNAQVWLNAAFGLRDVPVNYPLNFLRDMFVIVLLSPVINGIVRTLPFLGLIVVSAIFLNNYDGVLVLRGAMVVVFYLGALAAVSKVNMLALDKFAVPCVVIFLVACAAMVAFKFNNTTYLSLAAPFLIWPAASLLTNTKIGKLAQNLSKYSFFLFLTHAPVLLFSWMAYQSALSNAVPYQLYWVVAPVVVTAICIIAHMAASRMFPVFFASITGCVNPKKLNEVKLPVLWKEAPELAK